MTKATKNVLVVHPFGEYIGGAEYAVRAFVASLADTEYTPHVLIPVKGALSADLKSIVTDERIHYYDARDTFHSNKLGVIYGVARQIEHIVKSHDISIIHGMTLFVTAHVLLGGLFSKTPALIHWRDNHFYPEFRRAFRFIPNKRFRIIAISKFVAGLFDAAPALRDRVRVIHDGIDADYYAPLRNAGERFRTHHSLPITHPVIGIFSRLQPDKGHDVLLDALASLTEAGENITLCIFNEGPLHESLRAQVDERRLNAVVRFMGKASNIIDAYNAMDIIVLASSDEAFGRVTVEAMATEKIVVASNGGASAEIITDGEDGLLFERDDATALADTLNKSIRALSEGDRIRTNARKTVLANFTQSKNTEATVRLYNEMTTDC